jgi:putative inorganic carbon (HCO3(-)) transporter
MNHSSVNDRIMTPSRTNSMAAGYRLSHAPLKLWCFLFIGLYPFADFVLRHPIHLGIVSSLLEKVVLVVLALLLLKHYAEGQDFVAPPEAFPLQRGMKIFYLYGFLLLFAGIADFYTALEGWRAVYEYATVYFFALFLPDRRTSLRVLEISTAGAGLIGLHGIYQYIVRAPIPPEWIAPGEHMRTRVYSILGSPNVLGSYMALFMPVALGLAFSSKTWSRRVFFLGCAATSGLTLVFTFTRGAWLALFVAFFLAAAWYNRKTFFAVIAAAVAGSFVVMRFVPAVSQRIDILFSRQYWQESAQDGRLARWGHAFDQARENPLFGAGLGHYGGAVAARQFGAPYVDGYYFKTLAEMGLAGLVLLILVLLSALWLAYASWKKAHRDGGRHHFIALGLFVGLLAVAIHNTVENIFEVPAMNLLFWMFTGLAPLVALPSENPDKPLREEEKAHETI